MGIAKKNLFCFITGVIILVIGGTCQAKNLYVPDTYSTIQAAIYAAQEGDIVVVASGVYTGSGNKNLDYQGKAITVRSVNGPQHTIIDCQGDGRGVLFDNGEGEDSRFYGFTIRNGFVDGDSVYGGKGGGIYCYDASPTISNCIISNCVADGFGGGGIALYSSQAVIENTIIEYNVADECGGGLYIFNSPSPNITNSIIRYNKTTGYSSGGGICISRSQPIFSRCTISHNEADITYPSSIGKVTNSGGISFRDDSSAILQSSIISNNKAQERGGIGSWNAKPVITNCLVENNEATVDGGGGIGLYSNSDALLSNVTIRNNTAKTYGGGVSVWNPSASATGPSFTDVIIEGNNADENAGGMNVLDSSIQMSRSIIRDNIAAARAGLYLKALNGGSTFSVISNSLIANNIANGIYGGGGITLFTGAKAKIFNSTIVNNRHNGSITSSGGILNYQSEVEIVNSVLWGNDPSDSLINNAEITYSIISGGHTGEGNIDAYPVFISPTDFHLDDQSPAIDAGNNTAVNSSLDLGGNRRINNGTVDMGAYEYPFVTDGPGVKGDIGANIDFTMYPEITEGPGVNLSILYLLLQGEK